MARFRHRFALLAAVLSGALLSVGCSTQLTPEPTALDEPARQYEGYGNYHRAITTNSPEAQKWFDQGMQLLYGFNHDEAIRSFHEAARLDPTCAMAWWGVSYANGLHVNKPDMSDEQNRLGWEAAQRALSLIDYASPPERALIEAVARRYAWPPPKDRTPLDEAYAAAMREAWKAFPSDPDIGALYAEALMDLQPWDYWTKDGEPKKNALEIVRTLESVLALHPDHPGANHFYIHAVEASPDPARGLAAADRLGTLVPGSGHLVHMPAHIYARVGRYDKACDSNVAAIKADQAYFAVAPPPRFYRIYFMHNVHFLAWAAMMEGRFETAIESARQIERDMPKDFLRQNTHIADAFMPTSLHVLIRFGRWEDILKEPEPPTYRYLSRAMRHYARGIALANLDRTDEARRELAAFERVARETPDNFMFINNTAKDVYAIARDMLMGELSFREGKRQQAFEHLRAAAIAEDNLVYDEPPGWMHPVRHALGALLIADGKAAEAVQVYEQDLKRNPENGWALVGLEQALRAQGKTAEAAEVRRRRDAAWARADVNPVASCYCQPVGG